MWLGSIASSVSRAIARTEGRLSTPPDQQPRPPAGRVASILAATRRSATAWADLSRVSFRAASARLLSCNLPNPPAASRRTPTGRKASRRAGEAAAESLVSSVARPRIASTCRRPKPTAPRAVRAIAPASGHRPSGRPPARPLISRFADPTRSGALRGRRARPAARAVRRTMRSSCEFFSTFMREQTPRPSRKAPQGPATPLPPRFISPWHR